MEKRFLTKVIFHIMHISGQKTQMHLGMDGIINAQISEIFMNLAFPHTCFIFPMKTEFTFEA